MLERSPHAKNLALPKRAMFGLLLGAALTSAPMSSAQSPQKPAKGNPATAFFYGKDVPRELLAHYDRVVVEPDHFAKIPESPRAELFAYVSLGEVNRTRPWYASIPKNLFLGKNAQWGSDVVDTKNPAWQAFVLDRVIEPLWAKGYRGFFFDTLDSYKNFAKTPAEEQPHARQLGAIVTTLKKRHPDAKVVLNRGFDVLPHSSGVDGFVAESLYATCDSNGANCRDMPTTATQELLQRLKTVQSTYNVPITVIDYAPPDRAGRKAIANRIRESGFDPWVSAPALDEIGVGRVEIVPRRILLLYKSTGEGYLGVEDAAVLIAPALEWFGYAVDYADVREPLPTGKLAGRYAGIVTLLPNPVDAAGPYRKWLVEQLASGLRIAFIEGFGFDADGDFLAKLGLANAKATATAPMKITSQSKHFGFEGPVRPHLRDRPPVKVTGSAVRSLLRLEDAEGGVWDGAALAPWGGVAFVPYVLEDRLEGERRFLLDPFMFIQEALALPPIPAPDVTTEGGRRIMTAHLDGDAFVSRVERPGAPFTAKVVLEEILEVYKIPHTVSIVEGEVSSAGMYPQYTKELEEYARKVFALPHVEMASHTFSHPFEWEDAEAGHRDPIPHLAIPNYKFDLTREIKGAADQINTYAPPGKKVKVVLWTGNCSPSADAVGLATALGLFNVNGGGATRTKDTPSLTRGSPMGIPKRPGVYQVFAPVENENVYTNDWLGPFDGYRHAIETYELNDNPRRLSTLTIYYHFYSAAKTASLRAVKEVYDWALKQETTPLYLSQYAAKVLAFQQASLARTLDGATWEVGNLGELRTLRLDPRLGWPDMSRSNAVAGVRDVSQGRYMHLTDDLDRGVAVLGFSSSIPTAPRLQHANGRARLWRVRDPRHAKIRIEATMPVELTVEAPASCVLVMDGKRIPASTATARERSVVSSFRLTSNDTGEAEIECQ